ncbi:MAG: pilus assembly protein PilM [Candidatus Euphemobacter frigidus]|nr:pilus assembly protein PilM [Candidatus Euphemobacter frigidus]MDP8276704.1 pilus assembly protein PilM [Candidatus Euphemobacter frigidus]
MNIKDLFQKGSASVYSCRAIEIGTTGIRMVALKRSGKRIRLSDLRECIIPRERPGPAPPEVVLEQLRRLVSEVGWKEEVICSTLPVHRVFVRSLEMPFARLSQIRQVIAAEAEIHVPFPLEQVVMDFWPAEELAEGKTRVIMVAVKKVVLEAHLGLLSEVGLDPTKVSIDLLGSCRAYTYLPTLPPDEVTMLLEIGAVHTGVAFLLGGTVVSLRSFSWGGDVVTAAIMEKMGCEFMEAESMKAAAAEDSSLRDRIISVCGDAFSRLEAELLRTVDSAITVTGGRAPLNLILAGDATRQAGLKEYLGRKLDLKVLDLDPWSSLKAKKFPDHPAAALPALGLALGEVTPIRARLDFRIAEFAFEGYWEKTRRRLLLTAGLVVGLIVVLAAGLFWKIRLEEITSQNLARRISLIVRRTFPDQPEPETESELKAMKEGVEQAGRELKFYHDMVSVSALDILREISRIIPDSLKVQVVTMDINNKRVLFRGRTNSFRSVDLIKNALAKSRYFEGDKIHEAKGSKTRRKGGQLVTVEFEYNIPLAHIK